MAGFNNGAPLRRQQGGVALVHQRRLALARWQRQGWRSPQGNVWVRFSLHHTPPLPRLCRSCRDVAPHRSFASKAREKVAVDKAALGSACAEAVGASSLSRCASPHSQPPPPARALCAPLRPPTFTATVDPHPRCALLTQRDLQLRSRSLRLHPARAVPSLGQDAEVPARDLGHVAPGDHR